MSKHFIYLILGALTLATACTSTDTADELLADGVAVKFAARADSRAAVTTNSTITNTPFAVYGDMVPTANASTATPTVIFDGTPVTYADGAWSYTDPQYWYPGHTHSFVAIHPASALADAQYSNNQLSFTYTLPTDYRTATDILAATHRRAYTYKGSQAPAPVAFNFTHILSRLNFIAEVKNSQQNSIIVENLTLRNVHTSATYTIQPASITSGNQTDDYAGEWTGHLALPADGNQLFSIPSAATTTIRIEPGNDRQFFPSSSNPLFVIPQTIPEEIEIRIQYRADVAGSTSEFQSAVIYPFTLQHGGEWLPGKSYTYSFSIGVDTDITFKTPIVDVWVESLGGNYIISD